jgi:hypothetical protein
MLRAATVSGGDMIGYFVDDDKEGEDGKLN